jgi:hypothetical protein
MSDAAAEQARCIVFSYFMFAAEVDAIGFKVRVGGLETSFFLGSW